MYEARAIRRLKKSKRNEIVLPNIRTYIIQMLFASYKLRSTKCFISYIIFIE